MSLSSVWWLGFLVSLGGMYRLAMCRCLFWLKCSLNVCSSVFCVFMVLGVFRCVKVMLFFIYVIRPPPFLCGLSVLIAVYVGMLGVLCLAFSFVSCIVMMSISCCLAKSSISCICVLIPFMLICNMFSCLGFFVCV